jgi:hypothetical protein
MNHRHYIILVAGACGLGLAPRALAAKVTPDVAPPQRREVTVDTAEKLTQRAAPTPVPPESPNPFNPANFDQEAGPRPGPATTTAGPVAPPRPPGDREILESLASRLTPSGTFVLGGKPLLIIDRNRFEVGTKFIVTFNDQDYELELVTIDRTTFTLRYRGEEITRPIKPVK